MRHLEVRMTDEINVYLHEDGEHILTESFRIPAAWWRDDVITVTEATVRRFVRSHPQVRGWGRITDVDV